MRWEENEHELKKKKIKKKGGERGGSSASYLVKLANWELLEGNNMEMVQITSD